MASKDDIIIDTSLGLGLSNHHPSKHHHHKMMKKPSSFLSLSHRSSSSDVDHHIHQASCSSFSNSSVAVLKKEKEVSSTKKLRLTNLQSSTLEHTFNQNSTLNPKQKHVLAAELNLSPRQVEVWFQNRRARTKVKQTEDHCEVLRKCCEALTEENKRLQKEIKALKLSKTVYMKLHPPPICPSCHQRIAPTHHHFFTPLTHPSAVC